MYKRQVANKLNFAVSPEYVRDIVGDMVAGDQTGITVTHDDTGNVVDFIVDQAWLRDQVGLMFIRNTASIWPSYDRDNGWITLDVVNDWVKERAGEMFTGNAEIGMLSAYSPAQKEISMVVSQEYIRDTIAAMLTGNVETGIEVRHNDGGDIVNFVVDEDWVKTKVGEMLTGNTETGINVAYEGADHTVDFLVDDQWVRDLVGSMFDGNDGIGMESEYNPGARRIDLRTSPDDIVADQRFRIQTMAADMLAHNLNTMIEVQKHTDPGTSEIHLELEVDPNDIVHSIAGSQAIRDIAGDMATGGAWDGMTVAYDRTNGWLNFGLNRPIVREIVWDFFSNSDHNGVSFSHQPGSREIVATLEDDYIYNRMLAVLDVDNQLGITANNLTRKIVFSILTLDKDTIESGLQNVIGWGPD